MAISKSIEERIENVDLLTDFDATMIKEESQYMEVLALMFQNYKRPFSFTKELIKGYKDYKKNDDLKGFYSLFKNCPTEVLDQIVKGFSINAKWDKSIREELKPKNVGIISRNGGRVISKALEQFNYPYANVILTASNIPEIKNGVYTGNVEVVVDNNNLADFINKRAYICGREKRIVEKSEGIKSERLKSGLYLCRRKKIF